MELVLLPLGAITATAVAVVAFKKFWPSPPEPGSTAAFVASNRAISTGQIARGVFWGMWLFWLSQIVVAGVAMLVALLLGAVAVKTLGG